MSEEWKPDKFDYADLAEHYRLAREEIKRLQAENKRLSDALDDNWMVGPGLRVELRRLRNFARLLWAYYDAQWAGTREHGEMLDEGRKLGVVEEEV